MTDEFRIVIVKTGRLLFGRWRWAVEEKRVRGEWQLKHAGRAFTRANASVYALGACGSFRRRTHRGIGPELLEGAE